MTALIIPGAPGKGRRIAAVDEMTRDVQRLLNEIASYFDEPAVTLVVRNARGNFILTNDTVEAATAALLAEGTKTDTPAN